MSLRRAGLLALPLLVVACTDVTQQPLPPDLVFARFSSPNIPTPNDLALAALVTRSPLVNSCATQFDACAQPPNAQVALLCAFRAAGGFPADQEVPITIPFIAKRWDPSVAPNGEYVQVTSAAVDAASLNANTVTVIRVDVDDPQPLVFGTDFTVTSAAGGACTGTGKDTECVPATVTIRKASVGGSRRWAPGARYAAAVRGGPNGLTIGGMPVQADSAIALAIPHRDITKKENQPLGGAIPDSQKAGQCGFGSNADEIASLKTVSDALWNPVRWINAPALTPFPGAWFPVDDPASITSAFTAVAKTFPIAETASVATFGVAPSAGTTVLVDSGSGVAPLPIDLLRTDADGTVVLNDGFGAAKVGLDTLDGFSTTAMMLAQPSGPIRAGTVTGANVHLFKLGGTAPVLVKELKRELGALQLGDPTADPFGAGYVAEPDDISATCPPPLTGRCASVIGLQPAVTAPTPLGNIYLPPLDENTKYAVVITKRVLDVAGNPLARTSVANILLDFTVPLAAGGRSLIPGVNDATAVALSAMRDDLTPVLAALPAGTTKADIALAYSFKTQSITETSLRLAAAPYLIESQAGGPGVPAAVFQVASVTAATPPVPLPSAAGAFDVTFVSLDAIDKTTGTLRRTLAADLLNPGPLITQLHALVVTPLAANVPVCASPPFPAGTSCAKVVVVGHGLGGSKETLWAVADSLAARGFIAVATDFPMHGARAWCKANAECGAGGVCTPFPGGAGMGDNPVLGTCTTGAPVAPISGQGFVSANFFRIRDAFRQNLIDQSALVLAMARPPQSPQPVQDARAGLNLPANVLIDPSAVRWEGISLGAIAGTSVLATSPRFDRGTLAVGGTTLVGLFTDFDSAYAPTVDAVFAGIGIPRDQVATNPAVAAAYLQTINVAKWIVDPADPGNFAKHVSLEPLANLLVDPGGSVPQAAKPTLGQIAKGDANILNKYNELLYALMDSTPVVYQGPGGANVDHGFFGTTPQAQTDAATFLFDLTAPSSPVTLP